MSFDTSAGSMPVPPAPAPLQGLLLGRPQDAPPGRRRKSRKTLLAVVLVLGAVAAAGAHHFTKASAPPLPQGRR